MRFAYCALRAVRLEGNSTSGELGLLPPPLAGEGWGGGELAHMNLVGCPLPIPPAEVGFIRLRPANEWPNSGKPEFGCERGRGPHRVLRAYAGQLITGEALRGKKPNHLRMHAWSFAVLARKLSLQVLRQKRRPRWWWETRPNFPPQLAQRFSNLVMRLSSVGRLATPCCQARARTWRRIRSHRLTSTPPALCACQQRSAALAVR
jgi:hypothetical protein